MTDAVVGYDQSLPEIPDRRAWEKPNQHLVKEGDSSEWSVKEGRRESRTLLVPKIRQEVDAWRDGGYAGASEVTRRLFEYWFQEDHDVPGFAGPLRYHFCQREAIETLAWLVEIADSKDAVALVQAYGKPEGDSIAGRLSAGTFDIQTPVTGPRRLVRYVPESEAVREQDLPPKDLRRYAFKMATGSGKTWVMAMVVVWSYFHRQMVEDSEMSSNFLIVSPNVIVHQRLDKDFGASRIFSELPLIPPEWRGSFSLKVVVRGEATEPDPSGNLFLTNIQQLYQRDAQWEPKNPVAAILGPQPQQNLAALDQRSMLDRVKSLQDVVVINDEAHHVHDDDLQWTQALHDIREALPGGIGAWLDFSATPKDQGGMFFPWTVCDYPLAQAVEDQIVKAPLIVRRRDKDARPPDDPGRVTKTNVVEKYDYWIRAAVQRWREHAAAYAKLDPNPVLFVMAEKSVYADAIAEHLRTDPELGFEAGEILVIHTSPGGEISSRDLEIARKAARDIDSARSPIKVIVSVMMLREGWDVRNVTVVLGLRPYTAKSQILPEQVIGRGLRLMTGVGPDRRQTLEVLGTRNLLKVLRDQLEQEGVGVAEVKEGPPRPITIEPLQDRIAYDIAIPITKPHLERDLRNLAELDPRTLDPIFDQEELSEPHRLRLSMEFATTETEVHQADIAADVRPASEWLGVVTREVVKRAALSNAFAQLYPIVRDYVRDRCFGRSVNLDDPKVRSNLARIQLREGIAQYLAREIGHLTVVRRPVAFDDADHRLSTTRPFSWRRDLRSTEPRGCTATKTVFNYVATYNAFERAFAGFLDQANDVVRFAALGTTEQGTTGTQFRVDYIKPDSGAIGFYHPDWVAVQQTPEGEVHWIIETKGRVWGDTKTKDWAMEGWCARISEVTGTAWRYHRVNQRVFERREGDRLADLVEPSGLVFQDDGGGP